MASPAASTNSLVCSDAVTNKFNEKKLIKLDECSEDFQTHFNLAKKVSVYMYTYSTLVEYWSRETDSLGEDLYLPRTQS